VRHCAHTAVKTLGELVVKLGKLNRANIRAGHLYGTGAYITGTQLIGKVKDVKDPVLEDAMQYVGKYLQRSGQSHWAESTSAAAAGQHFP